MAITINSDGSGTGTTVTKPASVSDGDYLVVIMGSDASTDLTPPAGWTNADSVKTTTENDISFGISYKKVTDASSEGANYSFTASGNVGWYICALSGVDPDTPQDEAFSGNAVTLANDASPGCPTITTATDGAFILAGWAIHADNNVTLPGGDWTQEVLNLSNSSLNLDVVSQTKATAGAVGVTEITDVTSNQETACGQYAFRPYVEPATTGAAFFLNFI